MAAHDIILAAPRGIATGRAPVILDRDDADFIPAVLADCRSDAGRINLLQTLAGERQDDQTLKLFQPTQRRFHLALIEAWCNRPGNPRLDPAKVDAAGMVLRRVRQDDQGQSYLEGWMRAGGRLRGWLAVDRLGCPNADPLPQVRLARRATGQVQIDRALASLSAQTDQSLLDEQVVPMFIAPPEVCADAGQTLFYGVVQTASSELADVAPDTAATFAGFGPDSPAFTEHLMQPLRGLAYTLPKAGQNQPGSWFQALSDSSQGDEQMFLSLLRQIAIEFDAFGSSPESQTLYGVLQSIHLSYPLASGESTARSIPAGEFLKSAVAMLDLGTESSSLVMPQSWPALDQAGSARLAQALSGAMQARFAAVKGRPGRFDELDARYVLRAFVRLKPEGGCPGQTLWSDYSESFVIAPWYESGGTPIQIALPDIIGNRKLLKSLKPNVSFVLPPSLQNLLSGNPKDMLKGTPGGGNLSIGWICSFSIPIITLCAFFSLNIFLSLFDLFFRWMMFIKICIPFPKSGGK